VQVTAVLVAAVTAQGILSIKMVTELVEVGRLEPLKVTEVPPFTVPNLGVILVKRGVLAAE
jgi:hypothetical protein